MTKITETKQKDRVRMEIEDGVLELTERKASEQMSEEELAFFETENQKWLLELEERERLAEKAERTRKLEEESPIILEEGLKKVSEILEKSKGELVGAVRKSRFYDFYTNDLYLVGNKCGIKTTRDDVLLMIALHGADTVPHFDNKIVSVGRDSGDSSRWTEFLGDMEICSYYVSRNTGSAPEYSIFGKAVNVQTYNVFKQTVSTLLATKVASLSEDDLNRASQIKKQFDIEFYLKLGKEVSAGLIGFKHIYGGQSFGSGGAFGSVKAYDLEAFRRGEMINKEIETKEGNNQFIAGVYAVIIEPNTIIVAKGGDCIGEGREWMEVYYCEE